MGLLKEKTIKNERTGKSIGTEKNYVVKNRHKNSRAKSYAIEEPTYKEYLRIKERQSKVEHK